MGTEAAKASRALECLMERMAGERGEVECQKAAEEWGSPEVEDPDQPEPPLFPPPGVPGKDPIPR